MKKWISRILVMVMICSMTVGMNLTASAAVQEGAITIKGTTAGKTIRLYRMFSATAAGNKASYTLESEFEAYFTEKVAACQGLTGAALSDAAYVHVNGLSDDTARVAFAKDVRSWVIAKKKGTPTADFANVEQTVTAMADTTSISPLAYGFYVVDPVGATDVTNGNETVKSPVMLVNLTAATAEITMKSTYPTAEKSIVAADGNKDAVDVSVGDTLQFCLTSTVPDMTGYASYVFKFKDTLSKGLTFKNTVSVKIGTTELQDSAGYSFTQTNQALAWELNNFINHKDKAGQTIEILYEATLNGDAAVGMDPNTNEVKVEYSNDPENNGTGESTPSIVQVHTFDFTIYKYFLKDMTAADDATNRDPLAGAKFELYTDATLTAKVPLVDETGGVYRKATDDEAGQTGFTSAVIVTDDDGKVQVKGLKAGTYYLSETEAPAGYNKLSAPIEIVITPTYDQGGALTSFEVAYGGVSSGTITAVGTSPEIPVRNNSGAQLPSTGGMGTMAFTVVGVAIIAAMLAAGIISRKRKDE